MTNNYNLSTDELTAIEAMSEEDLEATARRFSYNSEGWVAAANKNWGGVREALAEALADGYTLEDFK